MSNCLNPELIKSLREGYPEELWNLLPVMLADKEEALIAWERWYKRFADTECSWGTKRQFSRVYWILSQHGLTDDSLEKLRPSFLKNQIRVRRFLTELATLWPILEQDNVPVMLLKSVTLIVLGYEALGSRTMYDIDVLVPFAEADRVFDQLQLAGWEYLHEHVKSIEDKRFDHGVDLRRPNFGRLDLHWNLMVECLSAKQDEGFWQRARRIEFEGVEVLVPSPSDLFFHICIHGFQRIERRYDWVIDLHILLQHEAAKIEWSSLVERARERKVVRRLQVAVDFLVECGVSIPETFHAQLARTPHSVPDRLEYYLERNGMDTWVGNFPARLAVFLRLSEQSNTSILPVNFLRFMQFQWGTDSVPATVVRSIKTWVGIQARRFT